MINYYECKYCLQKFVSERNYKKHRCKQMERAALMKKPTGMAAYQSFCDWRKAKGFNVHNKEQFMDSKLFNSFVKFTLFSKKIALPAKDRFIKYMVELDISPRDWTNHIVYKHYIEEFDNIFTIEEQVELTIDTIFELSKIFDCDTSEVFDHMEAADLVKIVQAKKMSPWFLLFSSNFFAFLKTGMNSEQRAMLESYIDPVVWEKKLKANISKTKKIKQYVRALGL